MLICEGHIALQKRTIGRFLCCRLVGSIVVLALRPAQEDDPVVLGVQSITVLQCDLSAGSILVIISNSTLYSIGIVGQHVLCLAGRSERALLHMDGCNQFSINWFGSNCLTIKINGEIYLLATNRTLVDFGVDCDCADRLRINYIGIIENLPDIFISDQFTVDAGRADVADSPISIVEDCAVGNRLGTFIRLEALYSMNANAVNGHIFHSGTELLCNQFLHGLDAIDVELGVVEFHRKGGGGQQCQHHGEDQEC